eukprot:848206-Alexandrium_andersonii.AAC.1
MLCDLQIVAGATGAAALGMVQKQLGSVGLAVEHVPLLGDAPAASFLALPDVAVARPLSLTDDAANAGASPDGSAQDPATGSRTLKTPEASVCCCE